MPPMSSLRTFIAALKTGETRTTKALESLAGRRRGATATAVIAQVNKANAMNTPLGDPLRSAIRMSPLPENVIATCIDGWPNSQKEKIRVAVARAIREGRRVRFRWGLTPESGFRTEIHDSGSGTLTITTLTPRSALRTHADGSVEAMP